MVPRWRQSQVTTKNEKLVDLATASKQASTAKPCKMMMMMMEVSHVCGRTFEVTLDDSPIQKLIGDINQKQANVA